MIPPKKAFFFFGVKYLAFIQGHFFFLFLFYINLTSILAFSHTYAHI